MSDAGQTALRVVGGIAVALLIAVIVALIAAGIAIAVRQRAARDAAEAEREVLGTHTVDWRRYAGAVAGEEGDEMMDNDAVWRELAAFPQTYQRDCACSEARYALVPPEQGSTTANTVLVNNRCETYDGETREARGVARLVPGTDGREARVLFGPEWLVDGIASGASWWSDPLFRWFGGDYWVYYVDETYTYAIVGNPEHTALWILTRAPPNEVDPETYRNLIDRAASYGFDVSLLQPRCTDFTEPRAPATAPVTDGDADV